MTKKLILSILVLVFCTINSSAANHTYKIEDLYAKKVELKNKIITIKGTITKISRSIMGKDWIHVQDDSKSKDKNQVLFTTTENSKVNVGDKVTAQGVLKADVDLGSGYFYPVLVEKSTFTK